MMIGREMTSLFPREEHPIGEVVFEARNVTCLDPHTIRRRRVDNVSLQLRHGEILGIAGLAGAGGTELVSALFGCYRGPSTAELVLDGRPITVRNPGRRSPTASCRTSASVRTSPSLSSGATRAWASSTSTARCRTSAPR